MVSNIFMVRTPYYGPTDAQTGSFKRLDEELESAGPLARRGRNDVAMEEVTHDPVPRRPVLSVAMEVVGADVVAAE
jgi:hypothetical protein